MMKVIRECGRARNAQGWRKLGPRGLCGNSNLGQPPYNGKISMVSGVDCPNKINPLNEYPNDGFRGIENRTATRSHPKFPWFKVGLIFTGLTI